MEAAPAPAAGHEWLVVFPGGEEVPLGEVLARYTVAQLAAMATGAPVDSEEGVPAAPAESSQAPTPPAPTTSTPGPFVLRKEAAEYAQRRRQAVMLDTMSRAGRAKWWRRAELCTTSPPTFQRDMHDLVDRGLAEAKGNRAGRRYRITDQGRDQVPRRAPAPPPPQADPPTAEERARIAHHQRIAAEADTSKGDLGSTLPPDTRGGRQEPTLEGRALSRLCHQALNVRELAAWLEVGEATAAGVLGRLVAEGDAVRLDTGRYVGRP